MNKPIKPMKAYYFGTKDRQLRYGDNRHIMIDRTHKVDGPPILCEHGLHGSIKAMDALRYAPGPILYEVELSGQLDIGDDKIAATERKYLRSFDATDLLREFARRQAMINITKIKPYCSAEDYNLIVDWLETGNEEIREAAAEAAWSARVAAGVAAGAAAGAAAWTAARTAARVATAAESAESAARTAARVATAAEAARSAANEMLEEMIENHFKIKN